MLTDIAVAGTVRGGILELGDRRAVLEQGIRQLPDGDYLVRVEPAGGEPQRSDRQNRYLHGVVFSALSDHTGYTISEIKLLMMGECWGWQHAGGHEIPIKPATHEMTREECARFIDWIIPWAMEHLDVALPLPNEGDV